MKLNKLILFSIAVIIVSVESFWREFEYISVANSKTGSITTDLKLARYNRTYSTLNGIFNVTEDLKDVDCQMRVFYSSKGNSQYKLTPFRIAREACCDVTETMYWKSVESRIIESSNFPKRKPNELYCVSLKPFAYTLHDFAFDDRIIPKVFDTGSYKTEFKLFKKESNEISSMAEFYFRLY